MALGENTSEAIYLLAWAMLQTGEKKMWFHFSVLFGLIQGQNAQSIME